MNIYLIDYPLSGGKALIGINELTMEDTVYIFYDSISKKITFEVMELIKESKANISTVDMGRHFFTNPLSIRLTATMGYLLGKFENSNIIVVSKRWSLGNVESLCEALDIEKSRITLTTKIKKNTECEDEDLEEMIE